MSKESINLILEDKPKEVLKDWQGYFHNTDPTILPPNCLTYPSQNCSIPNKDKIIPRLSKTFLGQIPTYIESRNWPIIGHKERFATMGGKVIEVRVIKTDDENIKDLIEVLYPNPLTGELNWYPITIGQSSPNINPFDPGLHRYYFDDWFDTDLNPAESLNVPRLIWVNGNSQIYSWIGAIAEIVNVTDNYLSVAVGEMTLTSITGSFLKGQMIQGVTSGATAIVGSLNGTTSPLILVNIVGTFVPGESIIILLESYSETNQSGQTALFAGSVIDEGQSFLCNNTGKLDSCKFYLKKLGTPTGNMVAKLYTSTGSLGSTSKPTGAPLAISDPISITTLTTSFALVDFEFSGVNRVSMAAATNYVIVVEYTGGDGSNNLIIGIDNTAPSYPGNSSFSADGTNWTPLAGVDICFYVYVEKGIVDEYTEPENITWESLGFESTNPDIVINGVEYTGMSGWDTPTLTFAPTLPVVSVGDVAFSSPRSDSSTTPLDVCRNNKNYMFYGWWKSRRYFQSNNFNRDDSQEITIAQADLDDLSISPTSEYAGDGSAVFRITIENTGSPDSFKWTKNGGVVNSGNGITGLAQALSDGVEIQFLNTTGHTVGDYWEITVVQSINTAWANFYYTLPVRRPGEGYIYNLSSNFWAMEPQEEDMYVNTQYGKWAYVSTILGADLQTETISLTPLKQSSSSKVLFPYMITHIDNDLIYVTENKTLDQIGRREFLELPQIGYLSQPVQADFDALTFEDGSMEYLNKVLYITSPKETIMLVYDNQAGNKYWQPPQVISENGILSIVGNKLITHSNLRPQSFILANGTSGDESYNPDTQALIRSKYTVRARTAYNAYGDRWALKNSNKSFLEGYIKGKPPIEYRIYAGVHGCGSIQKHLVEPIVCIIPTQAPFGEGNLASHPFGSDIYFNDLSHFNEIYPKFDPILEYYFVALELECVTTNHSYEWLTMGLNAVMSPTGNKALIPVEIISKN